MLESLNGLPEEARPMMERLLGYRLLKPMVLEAQVSRHLDEFEAECAARGNVEVARRLADWSRRMLQRWDAEVPDRRKLIQAAILYFVMDGDAADDSLPGGLDDDEAVMAAVMDYLEMQR